MKNILKSIFGAALIATLVYSCAPDDSSADNTSPTDPKQKWVASWNCSETSKINTPPNSNFVMHILDSANSSYVIIENLYNVGFQYKVKGLISGSSMSISNQSLSAGFTVNGSATMVNNSTLNFSYYVNDGSQIDSCTAVLTK